ncbi:MAG: rod shape-determining protein [Pseudobutyrivibrio sp.]|nr:rod shape-determining protein [Pseudobutyrivibrio sp.]MBP5596492.1 rod shape-determining protein [Pseudobutyrivibrio sp.]MBR5648521.1 rod shape-determining protein [Pseudobutyrivibrio sp.]
MMANSFGIDIGTQNLKIFSGSNNHITNIKNTIAIVNKNQMYSYGDNAYSMFEKAPDTIDVSFPIISGVIADFDNMQTMLFEVLEKDLKGKIKGADIVVAVPTDITEVEKKAFSDLFSKSKNKPHSIRVCEKPIACAIGMGLDVSEPTGVMVVDLGADTTEISVISLGGLVLSELLPFGGNQIDESIVTYMKRNFNLVIGQKTAKQLKEEIGSAQPGRGEKLTVVGRDVVSGLPIEMEVESDTVYNAMKADLESFCTNVKLILEKVPPELAKDIVHSGIYLTGGTSQLHQLQDLFSEVTNIKVNDYEDPEESCVRGLGSVLADSKFKQYGYSMKTRIFK